MKTRSLFLSAILCLSGCSVETGHLDKVLKGTVDGVHLSIEDPTKTTVEYKAEGNVILARWAAGDAVLMTDLVSTAPFTLAEGEEGKADAEFRGTLNVAEGQNTVFGVYPYAKASVNGSQLQVTLDPEQDASKAPVLDLKAVSAPSEEVLAGAPILSLKNLVSILRVSLCLPENLGGYALSGEHLNTFSLTAQQGISGSCGILWDGENPSLSEPDANTITYTFPDQTSAVGKTEFMLFLSPATFSQGEEVLWTIGTEQYDIRFRFSPAMTLKRSMFYNATFNLGLSSWNATSSLVNDRDYHVDVHSANPVICSTDSTPTTVSFSWSEPESQTNHRYLLELSDASHSVLRSYILVIGSTGHSPSFTFAGLNPDTEYAVRVKGYKTGAETEYSDYRTIRTQKSIQPAGNTLQLCDFDLCPWGGDYLHLAAAVKPTVSSTISSLSQGWSKCPSSSGGLITLGQQSGCYFYSLAGSFDTTYSAMLSELGLDGWTFSNVYMRPGYAQVGNGAAASLTSPALSDLPTGSQHTVNVTFKAVPYTASGSKSGSVTVTCTSGGGTTVGTQTVSLSATPVIPDALPSWQECSLTFGNVPAGSRISFSNGGASNDFCIDEIVITSDDALPHIDHTEGNVYGLVADTDGNPLAGVVVSDGYVVTTTDAKGVYQFTSQKANGYVFISQPQGYEVMLDGVFPQFWQALDSDPALEERHDFRLTPVDNSDCIVLALGDFHLCNRESLYDLRQFRAQVGELKNTIASLQAQGKKVYGLTLGDMTWDIYWDNHTGHGTCNFDLTAYRTEVNNDFAGTTFPIWHTIGNHDHDYRATGDWDTVIPYKQILGPTYYSFNVGGYHIVSLDNVICNNNGTHNGRSDSAGLTSVIQDWLRADIAAIPASMPVIISMHEQAYKPTNPNGGYSPYGYAPTLENLVSGHNVHIVTGHTHNINNVKRSNTIYEHNAGALCASWWWTGRYSISNEATWGGGSSADLSNTYHIGRDGAPGGYTIYTLSNGSMTWQYKGFGLPTSRQFKAYDRNQFALTAANWCPNASSSNQSAFEALAAKQPDYSYTSEAGSDGVPSNLVYINVWNWDPDWTITVKEGSNNLTVTKLTDAYDPMHMVAYPATRYNSGNGTTSTFVTCPTQHLFRVQASSATSTLTITVRDRFGNTYTETMTRPKPFAINWD